MIDHARAEELLPELAAGALRGELRAEVEGHVGACPECQGWLDTYRLLERQAGGGSEERAHLEAEAIARQVVRGEEPGAEARAHLARCAECRRELELSRKALAEARAAGSPGLRRWPPALRLAARAAAIAAVAALAFWLLRPGADEPADFLLEGQSLSSRMTVTANRSIEAARTEIAAGGEVTLRAGEVVALGEGFSVGPDASLTVEVRRD